jgi:hypothetical protein
MLQPEWLQKWGELPKNSDSGVARSLFLPVVQPHLNGKAFFIAGNGIFEFEDTLYQTQPAWMGEELSKDFRIGLRRLLGEE